MIETLIGLVLVAIGVAAGFQSIFENITIDPEWILLANPAAAHITIQMRG